MTDMKIPIEDLTGVILAISDTYRDYVRSGWQVGRHVELIQVAPPVGRICNLYEYGMILDCDLSICIFCILFVVTGVYTTFISLYFLICISLFLISAYFFAFISFIYLFDMGHIIWNQTTHWGGT